MKSLLFAGLLFLGFSTAMAEDLPQESTLQVRYQEIAIYEVTSVSSEITYLPGTPNALPSYQGVLRLKAIVEGNLCSGKASSVGTLFVKDGDNVVMKLVAAEAAVDNSLSCSLYSRKSTVTFTIPVTFYDLNHTGKLTVARIPSQTGLLEVMLTMNGPYIKADIIKITPP